MSDTKPLTPEVRAARKANMRGRHAPTWLKSRKWAWFWEILLSNMGSTEKLTAIALWAFANASFCPVYPSIANLATIVGVTERRMKTLVAEIESFGFIRRKIGGGRLSTRYEFTLSADVLSNNLTNANSPLCDNTGEDDFTGEAHFPRTDETLSCLTNENSDHVASDCQLVIKTSESSKLPAAPLQKVSSEVVQDDHDRRDPDAPSLVHRHSQFIELGKRVMDVDVNRILSEYLWGKKAFAAFVKIVDELGYDEFSDVVVSVAIRENARCNKPSGSIKTWAYFKKELVKELGICYISGDEWRGYCADGWKSTFVEACL